MYEMTVYIMYFIEGPFAIPDIKFIYLKNVHVIMFQIQILKYTKTNTNPLFIRRGMSVHISIKTVSQKIISLTKINFNHKIL